MQTGNLVISGILRHDARTTSYKLALIRAVNDVLLAFPTAVPGPRGLLIPLRHLAAWWIAYYWPFADADAPLYQGARNRRSGGVTYNDIGFRPELTRLRSAWAALVGGPSRPSDGFYLRSEMETPRRRASLPTALRADYEATIQAITQAIRDPIRYAGPKGSEWAGFPRPRKAEQYQAEFGRDGVITIPGTLPTDTCLLLSEELWQAFVELSLWVEALCLHEWCLFTESVRENRDAGVGRGAVYTLLTDRPDNRRPLTWERNQIDVLLLQGIRFVCPWTGKSLHSPITYDLDHVIPVALYPVNELWNLVPADPAFNSHTKRDRLPSPERIRQAAPTLAASYAHYLAAAPLQAVLLAEAATRFAGGAAVPETLASEVVDYVTCFGERRNVAMF